VFKLDRLARNLVTWKSLLAEFHRAGGLCVRWGRRKIA